MIMPDYDVTIPDELGAWVESRIVEGRYGSVNEYVAALVRRDHDENDDDALAQLRAALEVGRRSGTSGRSLADIVRDHMSARDAA